MTHLPYAWRPEDEFLHPFAGWLLLERAVVFDSWLSWRDVLPIGRRDCQAMTLEIHQAITALAGELHSIHQRAPNFRALGANPFKVHRWWDPLADEPWRSGRICLFQVDGYSSEAFIKLRLPQEDTVAFEATSELRIQASISQDQAAELEARHPSGERPVVKVSRRRPRTPPPGTPDCAPPTPGNEP